MPNDEAAGPVDDSWPVSVRVGLADLSQEEFGRWPAAAGVREMALLLLFRWDPDHVVSDYPSSVDAYESEARSVVLGLRMGDDRAAFRRRIGNSFQDRSVAELPARSLDDLWDATERWLAISVSQWWEDSINQTLRSLPFHCHLIKYDPARSIRRYDDGSWTSMSDIGSTFDGVVLTREEYLRVEQAHLDSLRAMVVESGVSRFRHGADRGAVLGTDEMLEQVRGALRGDGARRFWWTSEQCSFYVIVGWDYHVYVGSYFECAGGLEKALGAGLHPRLEGPSPYLDA